MLLCDIDMQQRGTTDQKLQGGRDKKQKKERKRGLNETSVLLISYLK